MENQRTEIEWTEIDLDNPMLLTIYITVQYENDVDAV